MTRSELTQMMNSGYRYALALCHDEQAAQDLVQEAWLRLFRAERQPESGYLIRIIRNCYIDGYRRAQRVKLEALDESAELQEDPLSGALPAADAGSLQRALSRLTSHERELLYLSAVAEYTAQEIADLQQRPRGSILSSVFRAKKKLVQLLSKPNRAMP